MDLWSSRVCTLKNSELFGLRASISAGGVLLPYLVIHGFKLIIIRRDDKGAIMIQVPHYVNQPQVVTSLFYMSTKVVQRIHVRV